VSVASHKYSANSDELFTISTKIIRKRLAVLGKNKSVGLDSVSGKILKLGGEAMISYRARLLDITINNATLPSDWKKAVGVPIYKRGDKSLVSNYRLVSLTSVVCKQMEHVIALCLRKIRDKNDWLFEGKHGFRPGYSCESQVITLCQDIADSLDNGSRIDAIIINFLKAFDLIPHDCLLTKIAASGVGSRVVVWIWEFVLACTQKVTVGGELSQEVKSTVRSTARKCTGSPYYSSCM
jgi:hypothetical protein